MQSACFCNSGSTLKPCLRTVTPSAPPVVGMPSWLIHDRNGYSLPKNHTPSVLPLKSSGLVMPVSLRQVSIMPERLKGWAILTRATPFSRLARAEGIQSMTTSAPPPAITCGGCDVGSARLDRDLEARILVEALGLRHVIAGELRLGHPLQLQRDALGPCRNRRRHQRARPPRRPSEISSLLLSSLCFQNSRLRPVGRMPKGHPALDERRADRRTPNPPVPPRRFRPKPCRARGGPLPSRCESPCRRWAFRRIPPRWPRSAPESS